MHVFGLKDFTMLSQNLLLSSQMEFFDTTTNTTSFLLSCSPSSTQSSLSLPPSLTSRPCAACKVLRRRCTEKCILAPYFPPTEPLKFKTAHRVFGACSIIKFLQELSESHRADAVNSMVYEANARIRDPVYGSAGLIFQLQKQVNELQEQLAKAQAELINMQIQQANLVPLFCMEMEKSLQPLGQQTYDNFMSSSHSFQNSESLDDNSIGSLWKSDWT